MSSEIRNMAMAQEQLILLRQNLALPQQTITYNSPDITKQQKQLFALTLLITTLSMITLHLGKNSFAKYKITQCHIAHLSISLIIAQCAYGYARIQRSTEIYQNTEVPKEVTHLLDKFEKFFSSQAVLPLELPQSEEHAHNHNRNNTVSTVGSLSELYDWALANDTIVTTPKALPDSNSLMLLGHQPSQSLPLAALSS